MYDPSNPNNPVNIHAQQQKKRDADNRVIMAGMLGISNPSGWGNSDPSYTMGKTMAGKNNNVSSPATTLQHGWQKTPYKGARGGTPTNGGSSSGVFLVAGIALAGLFTVVALYSAPHQNNQQPPLNKHQIQYLHNSTSLLRSLIRTT